MSSYHHNAEVRPHAWRSLAVAVALLVAGGCMLPFWWTVVFGFMGGVLVLFGGLMLVASVGQLLRGGAWRISATPRRLDWQSPAFAERSFAVDVADIRHVERRRKARRDGAGASRRKPRVLVHTRDGRQHRLHGQSGVDLERVLQVLADAGVPLKETEV